MAGVFNQAVLTNKGMALLAKAQAGQCSIKLTKAVTGKGEYLSDESPVGRTTLKNQVQEFKINTIIIQNDTNVYVKFIITNYIDAGHTLSQGYHVKEIGLYAEDPNEGEVLYAIAVAAQDRWDYMPPYNNLLPSTITVEMITEVTNASEVVIKTPNKMYLYDDVTGDRYKLGVENGLIYFEEEIG